MEESQSTSGKLSRALIEDLVLERDRVRAQFAELFTDGGFAQPEFARTVFALLKAKGLSLVVSELARPWLGMVSSDDFERFYLARLDAASRSGDSTPLERNIPLDLFEYLGAALPRMADGQPIDLHPDAARVEALLRFLKSAATDPALVLFRKNLPEMPPTKEGSPGTIVVPPAPGGEAPLDTPPPPAQVSRTVGSYQILEEIGRGGMGTVHVAYHTLLRKRFAIKILRNLPSDGEERERAIKRFTREARIYHELTHPNIVRLHEIFAHDGELLIVMEYVAGPNLRKAISVDRRFAPTRVLQIGIDIGEGLQAARAKDIIHRDPKPENILVAPDGHFKITDFGIARIVRETEETRVTEEKSVLGTVGYMSPEAVRGEEVDELADIYSLGAVLYHAATGVIPCYAPDPSSMMYQTLHKEPRAVSVTVDGFPPALEAIILRCLKKNKGDRFSGYPELLDALYEARKEILPLSSPGVPQSPMKSGRKLRVVAGLAFAAATLVALVWSLNTGRNEVPKKDPFETFAPTAELKPAAPVKESAPSAKVVPPPSDQKDAPKEAPRDVAAPTKVEPIKERALPVPSLREKLLATPPSAGAIRLIERVLRTFEVRYPELSSLSNQGLSDDLARLAAEAPLASPEPTSEEKAHFDATLGAARRLLAQAEGAFRAHLEELKASKDPVSIKLRAGGSVSGRFEDTTPTGIMLRRDSGESVAVEYARIAPDEFRPKAATATGELAYEALFASPGKALGSLTELAEKDDEALLWIPAVVRLARLEAEAHARKASAEAKPLLFEGRSAELSTACLVHSSAARSASGNLEKSEGRILPVYSYLGEDFKRAKSETDALELLFHRQYSRLAAGYRATAAGAMATALLLDLFERELASGSDELLSGTGWFNWRWELRPWDKDPVIRTKYLVPGPTEGPLTLQDPDGPRSLVMNDITSRAPEGLLIRLKVEPLGVEPERAEWRLHLLPEKSGTTYLRVTRDTLELYRSTLSPGAGDERLARSPLPAPAPESTYRAFALIPGDEYLHVYVDRELVISIPRADGAIPKQLSFVVYHAKASIKNFQAKRSPAPNGATRK